MIAPPWPLAARCNACGVAGTEPQASSFGEAEPSGNTP